MALALVDPTDIVQDGALARTVAYRSRKRQRLLQKRAFKGPRLGIILVLTSQPTAIEDLPMSGSGNVMISLLQKSAVDVINPYPRVSSSVARIMIACLPMILFRITLQVAGLP